MRDDFSTEVKDNTLSSELQNLQARITEDFIKNISGELALEITKNSVLTYEQAKEVVEKTMSKPDETIIKSMLLLRNETRAYLERYVRGSL